MIGKRATTEYGGAVRRVSILSLTAAVLLFGSCLGLGDGNSPSGSVTRREQDVEGKKALALGGNREEWNQISLNESPKLLEFSTEDEDLLTLSVPVGFSSYTESRAAQVTPLAVGIGYVTPKVDTRKRDPVQITIPPQKLIQILVGEARGQLIREATMDDEAVVKESSVSVTGNALGAVIRNRIKRIDETDSPSLFKADPDLYTSHPPLSTYEAVIEAGDGETYQFSPVDPTDLTHEKYLQAATRAGIEDEDEMVAYDQAVLTAAEIFNENTKDPTDGAFAFYSPSEEEYQVLQEALNSGTLQLPSGAGTSDARFPSLAPVQVLILSEVASATTQVSRPSFVFVRERDQTDPAVTDTP